MDTDLSYNDYKACYDNLQKERKWPPVEITKEMAIEMRERCGIGLMDAKDTLARCNGNIDDAIKIAYYTRKFRLDNKIYK